VPAEKNPVALRFGEGLRQKRLQAELSQEELADRASLHRSEIGLLERGLREPRVSTVVKLANALSIPAAELLREIE
jgi:transcriptional regulator with XRE-family HTH domain